jgi:pyruvate-formate lyase-activating enzyme
MRIQTMSVVIGTKACNARCPFCVSRMTGFDTLPKTTAINERNLKKAVLLAKAGGVTTVLFTGKGEPTLYPDEVTEYLRLLGGEFPTIELQTNGLLMGKLEAGTGATGKLSLVMLKRWYALGLDTIALSVVSVHAEGNRQVYLDGKGEYHDLTNLLAFLHGIGFQVRLCVMLQKGLVETPEAVADIIEWCRVRKVAQLTVRPIRSPAGGVDDGVSAYTREHGLSNGQVGVIYDLIRAQGTLLLSLMHGAEVYDVRGQNVCITDCLTHSPDPEKLRQIIFFAGGRLAYNWTEAGATLLQGRVQ